jgi:hypothetical protein
MPDARQLLKHHDYTNYPREPGCPTFRGCRNLRLPRLEPPEISLYSSKTWIEFPENANSNSLILKYFTSKSLFLKDLGVTQLLSL